MSNHMNSKYPNTIKNGIRKGTHLEAMFWETSKFNGPPLTRPFSQQASRSFCNCSWSIFGAELAAWPWNTLVKLEHSTIQQLTTDILAASRTTKYFFLNGIESIKCCSLDPHIRPPKLSPQWNQIESKHTKRTWSSMASGSHSEVTHDLDFVTESWMQLLVYFAPFFQPSCNVRRRFLIEKDS